MENQILSIDQMQKLIDMGIDTSKASHYICTYYEDAAPEILTQDEIRLLEELCDYEFECKIPTFTLQDILEMLPSYSITYDKYTNGLDKYEIKVDIPENQHYITHIARSSKSLLKAAFKMLKWCKQYNFI